MSGDNMVIVRISTEYPDEHTYTQYAIMYESDIEKSRNDLAKHQELFNITGYSVSKLEKITSSSEVIVKMQWADLKYLAKNFDKISNSNLIDFGFDISDQKKFFKYMTESIALKEAMMKVGRTDGVLNK